MDINISENDSVHPMDVEDQDDRIYIRENDPYHETNQQQQDLEEFDDRSRSPILTQRSTTSQVSETNNMPSPAGSSVNILTEGDDSNNICTCKNKKQKTPSDDYDDDDGKLCPICFDSWTTSGEHRVCALRCGHLFGHSCLDRWLQGQKSCPTCKRSVKKTDIRFIYAKKLIAIDTSELTILKLDLDAEKCIRNKLQLELVQSKQREEAQKQEIKNLNKKIDLLKTCCRDLSNIPYPITSNDWKIYKEKFFEVSKDGGCRVMDFCKRSNLLVVSSQSPNPLFSGFGIRKVQVNDFKSACYIPLHSAMIRDLSFHPERELLLSVSIDKCVRLTETANSKSVHTVQCSGPIWSCCWDITNPNYFFVGEQSGSAVKYDIRKANEKLNTLQVEGDFSPVVSMASAGWCPGATLPQGGIITCKLNSCSIFTENTNTGTYDMHPLYLEGPFVSMRYDNVNGHLLVTSRPNTRHPCSRHTLCTIVKNSPNTFAYNTVQVFLGSPIQKLLSRSCQMSIAGDILIAAHQEINKVVDIWSVSKGKKITSIPAHYPVLDLCPVITDTSQYLCTLSEKKVDFFKMQLS